MNKYIVPIFDSDAFQIWTDTISAISLAKAKEKLMSKIIEDYELDEDFSDANEYDDFVIRMTEYGIIIGDIEDIETL